MKFTNVTLLFPGDAPCHFLLRLALFGFEKMLCYQAVFARSVAAN